MNGMEDLVGRSGRKRVRSGDVFIIMTRESRADREARQGYFDMQKNVFQAQV